MRASGREKDPGTTPHPAASGVISFSVKRPWFDPSYYIYHDMGGAGCVPWAKLSARSSRRLSCAISSTEVEGVRSVVDPHTAASVIFNVYVTQPYSRPSLRPAHLVNQ